jgi:hypothetical protein
LKGGLFLLEGVAGSFARLAMDSDVSHLLHPTAPLSIECCQRADLQTIEEVLLNVTDRVLDAALFVSSPDITRHRLKAIVRGKIQITRIEDRSTTGEPLQDSGLKIVVHGALGTCPKIFQRVAVGCQEAFHTLAEQKLHIKQPAITAHRGKVMEFAHRLPDAQQSVSRPVDLHAIARFKGKFEIGLVADWSHRGNEVVQDAARLRSLSDQPTRK